MLHGVVPCGLLYASLRTPSHRVALSDAEPCLWPFSRKYCHVHSNFSCMTEIQRCRANVSCKLWNTWSLYLTSHLGRRCSHDVLVKAPASFFTHLRCVAKSVSCQVFSLRPSALIHSTTLHILFFIIRKMIPSASSLNLINVPSPSLRLLTVCPVIQQTQAMRWKPGGCNGSESMSLTNVWIIQRILLHLKHTLNSNFLATSEFPLEYVFSGQHVR